MKNTAIILSLLFSLQGSVLFGNSVENQKLKGSFNLPEIVITVTSLVHPTCNGQSSGEVSVEASGGKAPYTYNWNTFPNQHNATAVGLKQGVYFVYVSDSEGNSNFKSIEIKDPSYSVLTSHMLKSLDELDLTTTVKSNNSNLDYSLNELSIDSYKISDLPVGVHKLTVVDSKKCVLVQYIQVFELKNIGEEEIDANAEFVNESGGKIIVSALISGIRRTDNSKKISVIKKE